MHLVLMHQYATEMDNFGKGKGDFGSCFGGAIGQLLAQQGSRSLRCDLIYHLPYLHRT